MCRLGASIPWWGAILIAAISASSGIFAVIVQNSRQQKLLMHQQRNGSYLRFIAASEIVALRATILGSQRSMRNAFAHTLWDLQKAMGIVVFSILSRSLAKLLPDLVRTVADAIPTPSTLKDTLELSSLQDSLEDLVRASVEIHLYGSITSIEAADALIESSKLFVKTIESSTWTIGGLPPKSELSKVREELVESSRLFISIARNEMNLPIAPRA